MTLLAFFLSCRDRGLSSLVVWEIGDCIPDYDSASNAPLAEFTFPRTPKREFVAAFLVVLPIFDFADALVRPGGYGSKSCQPKNRK